jgi:hypothetical protein
MIAPNKVISLRESALGHVNAILREGPSAIDLVSLYGKVADDFDSIDQFILALDILFILRRIELNSRTRTVTYVA